VESGSDDPLYTPEEQQAVRRLEQALRVYECWDNGDLAGAHERSERLRQQVDAFQPPTAVTELHAQWPSPNLSAGKLVEAYQRLELGAPDTQPPDLAQSLYWQDSPLLVYAHDELAKVCRLIDCNEDYRSALIRAAGLHENLVTARVLRLWMGDRLHLYLAGQFRLRNAVINSSQKEKADKRVAKGLMKGAIEGLLWSGAAPPNPPDVEIYQAEPQPRLEKFWDGLAIDCEQFTDLRNRTVHFWLQVSRDVAGQAREMARRNLEEFEKNWRQSAGPVPACVTEALPWDQLCGLCGVTFLPPRIEGASS
jgi:hypothetical protein